MERRPDTIAARARGAANACAGALALSIVMTWPLATGLGRLGRTSTMDGLYSIWNVAWVARALVTQPAHLFDANIFFPHRDTLAYSESNIVAGLVAVPAWLATGNAYAAHNTAVLFAFATSFGGMFLLARRLSGRADSAAVAGILYAFCPYFQSHSAHIQLLMGGGIPLAMLALHRLVERATPGRGLALGAVLGVQALACAYYGIFAGLMVGYGVLFYAARGRLWRASAFWIAVAIAAVTAGAIVTPFVLPYLEMQRDSGFARSLDDAGRYGATWPSYLASPTHAHRPLLALARLAGWKVGEVLFPGVLVVAFGAVGLAMSWRRRTAAVVNERSDRDLVMLYGSLGALALWASFGPSAGLYTLLYRSVPLFTFLRAPSRFGVLLVFVLAIFASIALARWQPRGRTGLIAVSLVGALAIAELNVVPFPWERALPVSTNYRLLAGMPRGALAEFPFYGERVAYPLHAQYMVLSTTHWMPLVNGYSDHIPSDFREAAFVLDSFPSNDTFAVLEKHRVRYIGIHWDMYGPRAGTVRMKLDAFMRYLRPLGSDGTMTLYEVVGFP